MKTTKIITFIFVLVGTICIQTVFAQVYKANVDESSLVWVAKKMAGEHTGNINLLNGKLSLEDKQIVSGSFEIDMKSITNTDIEKSSNRKKLENHLKSDDFFSVEKFPITHFVISKTEKLEGHNYKITGDLTIKGITKKIEFEAMLHMQEKAIHVQAKIIVDRSKFDIRYGSKTFFSEIGNKMIYDDFELTVNAELKSE